MFRLREKGIVGSTELIVSVIFMLIMGIYAWKILERQKIAVLISNQNIEIVDILNSMRQVLASPKSCRASFENLLHNTEPGEIEGLIEFLPGEEKNDTFTVSSFSEKKYGQHGLKIKSYNLSKGGLNNDPFTFGTYLVVTFDRGFYEKEVKKEFKIFTKEKEGRITDCSLGHNTEQKSDLWVTRPNGDISTNHIVVLGSKDRVNDGRWKMLVNGGFQLFPIETECDEHKTGNLFATNAGLMICDGKNVKVFYEYGGTY